jgi:hypothetical protein
LNEVRRAAACKSRCVKAALPVYFMHVPKCAGVSIFSVIAAQFAERNICPRPKDGGWHWTASDVPGYTFYAGHFTRDFLDSAQMRGTRLIMVRHPLARVISLYDYWRSHTWGYIRSELPQPPAYNGPAIAKRSTLREFLSAHDSQPNPLDNVVAQHLLGRDFTALQREPRAAIAAGIAALRSFDWVGVAEAFDASLRSLCELLRIPPATPSRLNATYEIPSDGSREAITPTQPSPVESAEIVRRNQIDAALFVEARALLAREGRR